MGKRSKKKTVQTGREIPAKISSRGQMGQALPFWLCQEWFWGGVLLLLVILSYQPVWYAGFVWDDGFHVTANPCIVGPLGLKEIWTTSAGSFFPLVLTTFWVEHALWQLQPMPYHLVNVFQHALNGVLLWRVLKQLNIPGAWIGATLWAVHPLQVESVAWVAEMKNTQSTLFYLLTILFYLKTLKAESDPRQGTANKYYALTLIFALLAMISKSSTMVLPAVLGLCAWWVEVRWTWRRLPGLIPIAVMSIIAGAITIWPRTTDTTDIPDPQFMQSWPQRVAIAGDDVWFYVGKLLWPHPLMTIYPRWQIDAGNWLSYLPTLAVVVVGCILWFNRQSWARPYFFAGSYFMVTLSPFLGLLNQSFWRYSFVEDHLQYLAGMGPLALAGAGLAGLSSIMASGKPWLSPALTAVWLLILGALTWNQTWFYQNEGTLWRQTLAWNPNCWTGHNNLGYYLFQNGHAPEAMVEFQKGLAIYPNDTEALNNLGYFELTSGRLDEAIARFQKVLAINPNYAEAHSNLAIAFALKGQLNEAIVHFNRALKIKPDYSEAHNNLGYFLMQNGQVDEAIPHFQEALKYSPDYVNAQQNLAKAQTLVQQRAAKNR